jgi:hypothetical protein
MFVASTLYQYGGFWCIKRSFSFWTDTRVLTATGTSNNSNNNAGSSSNSKDKSNLDPKNARVKRNPKKPSRSRSSANGAGVQGSDATETGASPPPSYASVAADAPSASGETYGTGEGGSDRVKTEARRAKIAVIDEILAQDDLYKLLNVGKKAKTDEIRRGFLHRSRLCHPE